MTFIPGIQIASGFTRNAKGPVDSKQRLSTADRLNLDNVQRHLGMIVYDTDLNVWKTLITDPAGDVTVEGDWDDFGGGFSGTGIHSEVVVVGDTEGDVTITHDLGTYDLHVTGWLLPAYNKVDINFRMSDNDNIIVNGSGESRSVLVVIGTGGDGVGSNPYTAITGTYAEHKALADTNGLTGGSYYKITDYQTISEAGNDASWNKVIYTNPVIEPLIIQASTTSTFYGEAVSNLFPLEKIEYDFTKSALTQNASGGWNEGGGDWGDTITISSVLNHSWEINWELFGDDDFYIYVEDDSNDYEYHWSDKDTKFTITDIGGGLWRIDLIDTATDPISLVGTGNGYLELESGISLASIKGKITKRINVEKNIETNFDFRGVRRLKYKMDLTSESTWDSATTYAYNKKVIYNNRLYRNIADTTTNDTPSQFSRVWSLIMDELDHNYFLAQGYTKPANIDITIDPASSKLMPTFCHYDKNTETETFSLVTVENITLNSEDVVISSDVDYVTQTNIVVESGVNCIMLNDYTDGFVALGGTRNVMKGFSSFFKGNSIFGKLTNVVFYGTVENNTFFGAQACYFANMQRNVFQNGLNRCSFHSAGGCDVGSTCTDLRIGYMAGSSIKTYCNRSYIRYMDGCTIDYGMNYVYSHTDSFSKNKIGRAFTYTTIESGNDFLNNTSLNGLGGTTEARRWNIDFDFRYNNMGINCFVLGQTHADSRIEHCIFGNDVNRIIGTRMSYNRYGTRCNRITTNASSSNNIYGNSCSSITGDGQTYNVFGDSCVNIDTTGGTFTRNSIESGVSGLNIGTGADAMESYGNGHCDIMTRPDNGLRIKYINNSDSLIIGDPSV